MDHPSRAPTMNLHPSRTELGRADPLKHIFKAIFEHLPAAARGHIVATLGEFLGTMLFIILAFGCVDVAGGSSNKDQGDGVSTKPPGASPSYLLYAALGVGISKVVCAWTFFRISGGMFNPVISFGMALIGAITWARCLFLVIAQTSATIIAAFIVNALFNGGLGTAVGLGAGTSPAQGVVIEMILTGFFCFAIFMLAAEQHAATHLAPVGIGLALFVGQAIGLFYTGAAMNPARALAPCIVNREFPTYHWIYWVGPICGTIVAVLLYKLVKALEYETAQDEDGHEKFLLKQQLRRQASIGKRESIASSHVSFAAPPSIKKRPVASQVPVSSPMPTPPPPAHVPATSIMASMPMPKTTVVPVFNSASVPTKIPMPPPTNISTPAPAPAARPGPMPIQTKKEEFLLFHNLFPQLAKGGLWGRVRLVESRDKLSEDIGQHESPLQKTLSLGLGVDGSRDWRRDEEKWIGGAGGKIALTVKKRWRFRR